MRNRSCFLLALAVACAPAPEPAAEPAADTVDERVAGPHVYGDRVAIFMLADSATLARMRAEYGEEDYAVVGDDMMWYRAEAWSWLEEHGIPVVSMQGRDSLYFRVAGETRAYAFPDETTADLVVLYDSDREPIALAPVDVSMQGAGYYTDVP